MTGTPRSGSSATPYSVLLPERMRVIDGPCDVRSVTRFPFTMTVPVQVDAFARLFAPTEEGLTVSVNVPSAAIRRV